MKTSTTNSLTLYTFAMSHYSEKIRWTLDHSHIPYREVRMTPVFHILPALRMGRRGQTTLPILQTPKRFIQDSAAWPSCRPVTATCSTTRVINSH